MFLAYGCVIEPHFRQFKRAQLNPTFRGPRKHDKNRGSGAPQNGQICRKIIFVFCPWFPNKKVFSGKTEGKIWKMRKGFVCFNKAPFFVTDFHTLRASWSKKGFVSARDDWSVGGICLHMLETTIFIVVSGTHTHWGGSCSCAWNH